MTSPCQPYKYFIGGTLCLKSFAKTAKSHNLDKVYNTYFEFVKCLWIKVIKYVPDGIIHVLKIWGIYVIIKLSKKSGAGQKREGGKKV